MIDLDARFHDSAFVVSTPAIDAFIMQSHVVGVKHHGFRR